MRAYCKYLVSFAVLCLFPLIFSPLCRGETLRAVGTRGVVVASHSIAADVGIEVLKSGGNAVDAAVATGFALGVVDQFNSGIGGGGFIVIRMGDGAVCAIDGRETAPAAAARDMYLVNGEFDSSRSQYGPKAVGTPGLLSAYQRALEAAGTRSVGDLIEPSIRIAEAGFRLDGQYMERYTHAIERLKEDPASSAVYLHDDGSPFRAGELFKQPDLAATYRKIAEGGLDYFYRGEFAERLSNYMRENGGLITLRDMEAYSAKEREPIIGEYRGYTLIGMGPPSSGGVHVLQILKMLEISEVLSERRGWSVQTIFRTCQFMKKAFEDRARHLGDPDFYPAPVERLISDEYLSLCVEEITKRKWRSERVSAMTIPASGHTTNLCVVDQWGNAVAINQTVNLGFGAKITLPGTGVILNNEMDDFSAQPGVPNAFGLIGSEANSIQPGKRPLSSMAPTVVVKDNKPVLILGGAGGPVIITGVAHIIVNMVDFEKGLAEAQAQPRFHHQFRPDVIIVEDAMRFSTRFLLFLKSGRPVVRSSKAVHDQLGRVNAIAWSEKEQAYVGVPDPRGRGGAAAY